MVVSLSSHFPFKCRPGPDNLMPRSGDALFDDYINALNYSDSMLEEFINNLESRGLLKNTLLVIFGDHTIRMDNTFKRIKKEMLKTSLDPSKINDQLIHFADSRVPLVFYCPDSIAAGRSDMICSQIDLAPTILNMCNINVPQGFCGQDLFSRQRINCSINKMGCAVNENGSLFSTDNLIYYCNLLYISNLINNNNLMDTYKIKNTEFLIKQIEYSKWILNKVGF
jgi:phosphoglycerol transferase MdoB-like AlkP superfamily enzyme